LGLGGKASEPGDVVPSAGTSEISMSGTDGISVGEGTPSEDESLGLFSELSIISRYSSITDGSSLLLSPVPRASVPKRKRGKA
jgi:hypothetical protein